MSVRRAKSKRRVLVVTGSRSEFGLLRPVMDAIHKNRSLDLHVVVAGEHLLAPDHTWKEVTRSYRVDAKVPMQRAGETDRLQHAAACARGMAGFAAAFGKINPDWVVVLGDRIEAFAAASAASIGGIAVCHIHGGDRAEGVADEAMRHAITKLAHLHCAATKLSADRIVRMGEPKERVVVTGSPAIDGLADIRAMSRQAADAIGDPIAVVLHHPAALPEREELAWAATAKAVACVLAAHAAGMPEREACRQVLLLDPNSDPGRTAILASWGSMRLTSASPHTTHLPRTQFVALLKRLAERGGVLVGNSSAGLIEAAALGVRVVNLGPRQNGRERAGLVVDMPDHSERSFETIRRAYTALARGQWPSRARDHPYGDGDAGRRIAAALAACDPHTPALLRKRNSY